VTPYPKPEKRPHNLCRSCSQDFNSIDLFERHRVGVHEYTYAEGVKMDPIREDGRRCLSIEEMHEKGWTRNERGYWIDPERVEAARAAFRKNT
jgi:hypothetical protein